MFIYIKYINQIFYKKLIYFTHVYINVYNPILSNG